jgi:hypothetical protein
MRELSLSNIEHLKEEISNSGITYSHLLDDLIDHVCCDVEHEMLQGLPFDKAYERVKRKIGSNGLHRIQENTMLLIDKNYRIMKTLMKISGVIAPVFIALGTIFRIEHWPLAGILIVTGFFFLGFLFLPSVVYVTYKEVNNRTKKLAHILGFFSAFLVLISFVFKVMHWPWAGVLMLAGMVVTGFLFLPVLLYFKLEEKGKHKPGWIYTIGGIGTLIYCAGFTFKIFHWPGAASLLALGAILLVFVALPVYVYNEYRDHEAISNRFIFILFVSIWFILPTMLIALNMSSDVWQGFIQIQQSSDINIQHLKMQNKRLTAVLTGKENFVIMSKVDSVNKESAEVVALIDSVRSGLLSFTDNEQNDQIDLRSLNQMDEISKSSQYMAGDWGKGFMLAKRVNRYSNILRRLASEDEGIITLTDKAFRSVSTDSLWVKENFEHMPLANTLNLLNLLEERVFMVQSALLHKIYAENRALAIADLNVKTLNHEK